ncbi:MAG: hypothetical protein LBR78_01985 [Holosporales bacterium]|nr:hypothetical protein [Holosporales bacterium]
MSDPYQKIRIQRVVVCAGIAIIVIACLSVSQTIAAMEFAHVLSKSQRVRIRTQQVQDLNRPVFIPYEGGEQRKSEMEKERLAEVKRNAALRALRKKMRPVTLPKHLIWHYNDAFNVEHDCDLSDSD